MTDLSIIIIITTFRLSFIMYLGNTRTAGRPCVVCNALWGGFWITEKYFWDELKNAYIDVILHVGFTFDIIFAR